MQVWRSARLSIWSIDANDDLLAPLLGVHARKSFRRKNPPEFIGVVIVEPPSCMTVVVRIGFRGGVGHDDHAQGTRQHADQPWNVVDVFQESAEDSLVVTPARFSAGFSAGFFVGVPTPPSAAATIPVFLTPPR